MDKLKDFIICKLGNEILTTMLDPIAEGWTFEGSKETAVDGIAKVMGELGRNVRYLYNFYSKLRNVGEIGRKREAKDEVWLASRIPDHDLVNICWRISQERASESEKKHKNLALYTRYRAFCLTMPYIASGGDQRFLSQIPVEWLPKLFNSMNRGVNVAVTERAPSMITTAQYVALEQLVKNSWTLPSVHVDDNRDYTVVSVVDSGHGLCHKPNEYSLVPLSDEEVPLIFGDFSTRTGGGKGLQIVKVIAELDGGYVRVTSTHKDPEWRRLQNWGEHFRVWAELSKK